MRMPSSCSLSAQVIRCSSACEVADPTTLFGSSPNPVDSLNVGHASNFLYKIEDLFFSIFPANSAISFLFSDSFASKPVVLDINTWNSAEDRVSMSILMLVLGEEVLPFYSAVFCLVCTYFQLLSEFTLPRYSDRIVRCNLQPGSPVPGLFIF